MQNKTNSKLIPLTKWNEFHIWPTVGGLRHLVANAKKKKFDKVIVKANGRILIDEDSFFDWAKSNKE